MPEGEESEKPPIVNSSVDELLQIHLEGGKCYIDEDFAKYVNRPGRAYEFWNEGINNRNALEAHVEREGLTMEGLKSLDNFSRYCTEEYWQNYNLDSASLYQRAARFYSGDVRVIFSSKAAEITRYFKDGLNEHLESKVRDPDARDPAPLSSSANDNAAQRVVPR